jgi:prophage regulatory protein
MSSDIVMAHKLIRLSDVRKRVPFSRSAIYLLVSQGKFPKPVNIGPRAVAWIESEIDAWVQARIAESRNQSEVA